MSDLDRHPIPDELDERSIPEPDWFNDVRRVLNLPIPPHPIEIDDPTEPREPGEIASLDELEREFIEATGLDMPPAPRDPAWDEAIR